MQIGILVCLELHAAEIYGSFVFVSNVATPHREAFSIIISSFSFIISLIFSLCTEKGRKEMDSRQGAKNAKDAKVKLVK